MFLARRISQGHAVGWIRFRHPAVKLDLSGDIARSIDICHTGQDVRAEQLCREVVVEFFIAHGGLLDSCALEELYFTLVLHRSSPR